MTQGSPTERKLVADPDQLASLVKLARRDGKRVGLVPTMGALHEGHLSLVRAARSECDWTVVSIFVNPTQFGPNEDFARYPRDLDADVAMLDECGVDLVFAPDSLAVYPPRFTTWVDVGGVAEPLEGESRPGHFRGVATVVLKLLNMVGCDAAYFGQKDYQQSLVVRRMVTDLNVPVEIRVCRIVREPDGLAMSSRNRYLSPDARRRALVLYESLGLAGQLVADGGSDAADIAAQVRRLILDRGGIEIDYVALADPETLATADAIDGPTLLALAVRVEGTRLIDNCILRPPEK